MEKAGRNDNCPCGSGKKYKHCCLSKYSSKNDVPLASFPSTSSSERKEPTPPEINKLAALFNGRLLPEVEKAARHLLIAFPSSGHAWNALGAALLEQDKEAITELQRARLLLPGDAECSNNLGKALLHAGRVEEAVAAYRQALELRSSFAEAECGLANALLALGQIEAAIAGCRRALKYSPHYAMAHNNLGNALRDANLQDDAIASYHRAVQIDPGFKLPYNNLGNAFRDASSHDHAVAYYRRALAIDPHFVNAYDNLLMTLLFMPSVSQVEVFKAHRQFAERFEAPLRSHWRAHGNKLESGKRLKIGYVSADFREHAVSYFMEPVLANHDKAQVEVYCYANSVNVDQLSLRLMNEADHWISCVALSDEQLAQRIRADGIDILIDLSGHTAGNRLLVFARKPAPVQITYLGYPGSSGLSAMDYRLTDHYTEPGDDEFYSEKLLRLPDSMWCYRPSDDMPDVTPLPALSNGYVTFGSFNNVNKVGDACIALWARLLQSIPTAHLRMATVPEGAMRQRLTEKFEALGVQSNRISFCGKLAPQEFKRELQKVDLTLDPFPVNGATTTCESLWLGVPVLTIQGQRFMSRAGLSVLSAAGLSRFVAKSADEFIEIAKSLSTNLSGLANVRAELRNQLSESPLLDHRRFARNLENVYRDVWSRYVLQKSSSSESLSVKSTSDSAGASKSTTLPPAVMNRLLTLFKNGNFVTLESEARAIFESDPHCGFAWQILGAALEMQGKDGLHELKMAAQLLSDDAGAHNNLAKALRDHGWFNEAIESYRRAIALKPDFSVAHSGLGMTLRRLGQLDAALESYRHAITYDPRNVEAYNNMGRAYQDCSRYDLASVYFNHALEIKPDYAEIYNNMLMAQLYLPDVTQKDLFVSHRRFGEQFEAALRPHWLAYANLRDPNKRLKIAYVSGDFRQHPVAYFFEPILNNHDKERVEVFCYSNSAIRDGVTDRLFANADHWHSCVGMTDEQLAQRIRADGIDILVDLSGHSAHNRLLTFARKPAPIQITYLGYPGSTGLSAMDYRLTDRYTDPASDPYYTEKLLRLSGSMWCYQPIDDMPEVTPLPALTNGYLTFGSFNNVNKVGTGCMELWAALLRRLPTSRLLMATVPDGETRQRLLDEFKKLGVSADRIDFCGKLPSSEFMRKLQQIDISLDPFPVNGATTTCESLWLGVPVLSLVGERFVSRAGLSVLSAAGLSEFAAKTQEEFISLASDLANDLPKLAKMRAGMRERLSRSPLMDQQGFTRNLEAIYREVWQQYVSTAS